MTIEKSTTEEYPISERAFEMVLYIPQEVTYSLDNPHHDIVVAIRSMAEAILNCRNDISFVAVRDFRDRHILTYTMWRDGQLVALFENHDGSLVRWKGFDLSMNFLALMEP